MTDLNDSRVFRVVLESAIAGSVEALELIMEAYEPMLRKYSTVDGRLDEDLRQTIWLRVLENIGKFRV